MKDENHEVDRWIFWPKKNNVKNDGRKKMEKLEQLENYFSFFSFFFLVLKSRRNFFLSHASLLEKFSSVLFKKKDF